VVKPKAVQDRFVSIAVKQKIRRPLATATVFAGLAFLGNAPLSDAKAQILGSDVNFGVLAASTVTNTGTSVIQGNVGVYPGTALTGFPPGIVVAPGTVHLGDAVAHQAQTDLTTAYNTLAGLMRTATLTGQDLGGKVLTSGTYFFATSAQLTGTLVLSGNASSQFVFQIGSTLTTASASRVLLLGNINPNNVYWQVGSSATLGTGSAFAGSILAQTSISLGTGAVIGCGRALAENAAVTLQSNTINICSSGGGGGGGGGGEAPSTRRLAGVPAARSKPHSAHRAFSGPRYSHRPRSGSAERETT
jgi:hypothetical protein